MRTRIVKIGNSQGIRIPRALLEQTGLAGEIEIVVEGDTLVIRRAAQPRQGWGTAFREATDESEGLLDPPVATAWETSEWEWTDDG